MPCYVTYKVYATIKESELSKLFEAAKKLGLEISDFGTTIKIGSEITLKKVGDSYDIISSNPKKVGLLMEEYSSLRVTREARKKRWAVKVVADDTLNSITIGLN